METKSVPKVVIQRRVVMQIAILIIVLDIVNFAVVLDTLCCIAPSMRRWLIVKVGAFH